MIFKSKNIIDYIDEDGRFPRIKHNPCTLAAWKTTEFLHLNKELGRKGLGKVHIRIMDETSDGVETIIEIELNSGGVWETFFEGFLDNVEDLKNIFRMLGL